MFPDTEAENAHILSQSRETIAERRKNQSSSIVSGFAALENEFTATNVINSPSLHHTPQETIISPNGLIQNQRKNRAKKWKKWDKTKCNHQEDIKKFVEEELLELFLDQLIQGELLELAIENLNFEMKQPFRKQIGKTEQTQLTFHSKVSLEI